MESNTNQQPERETIAPDRLDRFTTHVGDLRELSDDEVKQIMTPEQARAKHDVYMKQKYGDDEDNSLNAPIKDMKR